MKPPWLQQTGDAELEALQTDVMRFIAILGLCLAAIFSLVHSAVLEENAPIPPMTASTPAEAPSPLADHAVAAATPKPDAGDNPLQAEIPDREEPPTKSAPPVPPPPAETGFSLEFASDAALLRLLRVGQVQLYAKMGGHFWVLDPGDGAFSATQAPRRYYQMLTETVPLAHRRALAAAAGGVAADWGVHLSPELVERLQGLVAGREGGSLVIQGDGRIDAETTGAAALESG